jgi:hypothetical protein
MVHKITIWHSNTHQNLRKKTSLLAGLSTFAAPFTVTRMLRTQASATVRPEESVGVLHVMVVGDLVMGLHDASVPSAFTTSTVAVEASQVPVMVITDATVRGTAVLGVRDEAMSVMTGSSASGEENTQR